MKKIPLLFLLFLIGFGLADAQNHLKITGFDYSKYPDLKAKYFLFSKDNFAPISAIKDDFRIFDNGSQIVPADISCPSQTPNNENSFIVSFDAAISVGDPNDAIYTNAIQSLKDVFTYIDYSNSKAGLTSFTGVSSLIQDLTNNRDLLLDRIKLIAPEQTSIASAALLSIPTGSINLIKDAAGAKSIILVCAGMPDFKADSILKISSQYDIKFYVLYFGKTIPTEYLKLAEQSNGRAFANLHTAKDLLPIVRSVVAMAEGYAPCEISWQSNADCSNIHDVAVSYSNGVAVDSLEFVTAEDDKPYVLAEPSFLEFRSVLPGKKMSQNITLTAKNGDITIDNFNIPSTEFKIIQGDISSSFILEKNKTHTLKIEYSPIDSLVIFSRLVITSSACSGKEVLLLGGFPNKPPRGKDIHLISPACNDILAIGDTSSVTWEGVLEKDVVQLEYSTNGGTDWKRLAKDVNGLKYLWPVPHEQTNSLLVRVLQLWPNNVGKTMDLPHSAGVNWASFNTIGDKVVTAATDSTAIIWNSNNGAKLFVLSPNHGQVNSAVFSPNGEYVLTASADGNARLWSVANGTLVRAYPHTNGTNVASAQFNHAGDRIITVCSDGKLRLMTLDGNSVSPTFPMPIKEASFAVFHPDDNKFFVAANDGVVRLIDYNGSIIGNYDTKETGDFNGYTKHISVNKAGTLLAASNDIGKKVVVFSLTTNKKLYKISHSADSAVVMNATSFFYNSADSKEYLLTTGIDGTARRWNALDGSIPKGSEGQDTLHKFAEHRKSVQTAFFNFDGSRLLTASWDSTAKIWNLNQRYLQIDTIDCSARIALAKIKADSLDCGQVYVGSSKTRTAPYMIKNISDFKFKITGLALVGGDKTDFALVNLPDLPLELLPNETMPVSARFAPSNMGQKKAILRIYFTGDSLDTELSGECVEFGLSVNPSLIDFGEVETDDFKDLLMGNTIENISDKDLKIDSIVFLGPDANCYSLMNKSLVGATLASKVTERIELRFIPGSLGRKNAYIKIYHTAKGSPAIINLFGAGVEPAFDTINVVLGTFSGKPGETGDLPISIKVDAAHAASKADSLKLTLLFNSTLIAPMDAFSEDMISEGLRRISMVLPCNMPENTFKIKFRIGLGNDTVSTIHVVAATPLKSSKVVVKSSDGEFKLTGWCSEGGPRLIEQGGKLVVGQFAPNPSDGKTSLTFSLIEDGETSITIYDYTGKPVAIPLPSAYMNKGEHTIAFDASALPNGTYFYILKTPSHSFTGRLVVGK